jgi:hypothetical protein
MNDLRERLAGAITNHRDCSADATTGEWRYICDCGTVMPTNDVDEADRLHEAHQADAAAEEVTAWLRERAETEHDPNCGVGRRELGGKGCAHFDARWRRDFAITLADEIERREASDGD